LVFIISIYLTADNSNYSIEIGYTKIIKVALLTEITENEIVLTLSPDFNGKRVLYLRHS